MGHSLLPKNHFQAVLETLETEIHDLNREKRKVQIMNHLLNSNFSSLDKVVETLSIDTFASTLRETYTRLVTIGETVEVSPFL